MEWKKKRPCCRDPGLFRAYANPSDLNQGPSDLQSDALPTELSRQLIDEIELISVANHSCEVCSLSVLVDIKVLHGVFPGQYIPSLTEHKLRRHQQRFRKITTTAVFDNDENFLWSRLQLHRSCHGNEMTPLPIFLEAVFLGSTNFSSNIVHGCFFLPTAASMFVMFKRNLLERYRDILGWRTVKTGQSWCSAVICRKRSAFETHFYLMVVSIFLKTCVEDNGGSFSRLQERRFDYYVLRRSY